jgi:hypothetical protein
MIFDEEFVDREQVKNSLLVQLPTVIEPGEHRKKF